MPTSVIGTAPCKRAFGVSFVAVRVFMSDIPSGVLLQLTRIIFEAYISRNAVPVAELPSLLQSVHSTLGALATGADVLPPLKPAVSIKRSITPEYLICLEDGGRFKMLKRYLRTRYDLTPEQYRTKWGLPLDYPMTAPSYAARRAEIAKRTGLGRRPHHTSSRRTRAKIS